jgi:hypothetical protein
MDHKRKYALSAFAVGRAAAVLTGILAIAEPARATDFDTGSPEWKVRWDNRLQYIAGMRTQANDPKIAADPLMNESESKFGQGDLVTNRLSLLSEFDASYESLAGVRLSGSGWNDFAYNDKVKYRDGNYAPGTPYSALGSYSNGKYTAETKRWFLRGAQLLDAFVWTNFNAGPVYTTLKVGRLTQLWGSALFLSPQSIQFSQNAADNIKLMASPGTLAKELAIPRGQVLASFQVHPELTITGQYFGEYQPDRMPAGGTFLGFGGPLFSGPNQMMGGAFTRDSDLEPKNLNDNWGVKAAWTPGWMDGSTVAGYFRHFDETSPWFLFDFSGGPPGGGARYHLGYAKGVNLYGLSVEGQIAGKSVGFEASYREHTALNSVPVPLPTDPSGREGARGDTVNAIANVMSAVQSPLWDTSMLMLEAGYTHKLKVSSNADMYNGTGNRLACPSGSKWAGCSTDDAVAASLVFDPSWLAVLPGLDLDVPLFAQYGVYGNIPSLGSSVGQGSLIYTAGVHVQYRRKYNATLQYNGFFSPTRGVTDTPSGAQYYAGGTGAYMLKDRGWVSLAFSTTL